MRQLLLKLDPNIWLILALSVFAWAPLLTPAYFFNAHDARHSVFFLVEFDQTFRDGYWWPRWAPDFAFGYGYPLFSLYAPLAFYTAELLVLLGWGFTAAVKTVYILATIGAGLGMYGFARRLYGPAAGLLAGISYMYVPFHLVEIYVRSAYAEFVSLAIIPLLFWAFTELIAAPSPRRAAVAGLAYGLLALTHHTSFFTFSPLLMVYILFLSISKGLNQWRLQPGAFGAIMGCLKPSLTPMLYAAAAGVLGLMLAAIYLLPAMIETRYIKVEQWTSGSYNYLQHFVYFSQFLVEQWGYGYSGPGVLDDLSYQLGAMMVSLMAFALVSIATQQFPHRGAALFFLIATGVIIPLMSPVAEPIWQVLPIASLVQFPWRLLAVTAFTMSIAAGALIASLKIDHTQMPALILLSLAVVLASFAYTLPEYTEIPNWAETPLAVVNWDRGSIIDRVGMVSATEQQPQTSPMEQQYLNNEPLTTAGLIRGRGTVDVLHHGGASDRVRVEAAEPVTLQFYTYDYPGWQVSLNGQTLQHRHEPPYGLITVDLPAGEHVVELRMGSTPVRTLGAALSGIVLLAIAATALLPQKLKERLPFFQPKDTVLQN
jgi:hypothetical protein